MKWADFEKERRLIRNDKEEAESASKSTEYPKGSSRDQVNKVKGKQSTIRQSRDSLEEEIAVGLDEPEELLHASLPWDMPSLPMGGKSLLLKHNDNSQRVEKICEAFANQWRKRKDYLEEQWQLLE